MQDEGTFQRYGTPLEPLEEDAVPSKKPIYVEDQIVTDENGRRRFHGAFTGGFSAGYWNTVGSQEGWTPQSFKSSRSEKADRIQAKRPEDFMDSEDLGEFGIAPQRLQIHKDFAAGGEEPRKRKLLQPSVGPIPGVPVLHQLLKPETDKIAVRMLKNMGWRPGQGVGARQTHKEKKKAMERNQRELYVLERYGCETGMGSTRKPIGYEDEESNSSSDDDEDEITYAPDDYEPYPCVIKNDRFGLGYTGLSREPVLSQSSTYKAAEHINLFGPLEVVDKHNKKLSISGQAFGVGALEEEDEDIYARDDMTKYDFSLEEKKTQKKKEKHVQDKHIIDGFAEAKHKFQFNPFYTLDVPTDFRPRNWAERRSRFAPLDPERAKELDLNGDLKKRTFGRHDMKPEQRGRILGEAVSELPSTSKSSVEQKQVTASSSSQDSKDNARSHLQKMQEAYKAREARTKELLERISSKSSNFTRGGIITAEGEEQTKEATASDDAELQQETADILAKAQNKTKHLASASGGFKPFLGDDAKQQRYEDFLAANLHSDDEIAAFLRTIQPVQLSEWDREMEKQEFIQARKIYKPLGGIMSDRFVSEAVIEAEKTVAKVVEPEAKKIVMERTKSMWKPSALLCKRYNIAEPFGGALVENKPSRKSKLSVFDYLETSINTKANFQTPVIIPKHIEKPQAIVKEPERKPPEDQATEPTLTISAEKGLLAGVAEPEAQKPAAKVSQPKGFVPKTDLEKRVVESTEKHPSQKVELFKAIFEDDSDEEEATADKTQEQEESEPTANNTLAPSLSKPTSAAAANLLRNTSPPRGIFAALFTSTEKVEEVAVNSKPPEQAESEVTKLNHAVPQPPKVTFKPKSEREPKDDDGSDAATDVYGPKLPTLIKAPTASQSTPDAHINDKLLQLLEKHKSTKYANIETQWVEKGQADSSDSSESSDSSSLSDTHKKKKKKLKKKKSKLHDNKKSKKKDKKKSHKHEKSHKSKKHKRK